MINKISIQNTLLSEITSKPFVTSTSHPPAFEQSTLVSFRVSNAKEFVFRVLQVFFFPILFPINWIRCRILPTTAEMNEMEETLGKIYGAGLTFIIDRKASEKELEAALADLDQLDNSLIKKWIPNVLKRMRIPLLQARFHGYALLHNQEEVAKSNEKLEELGYTLSDNDLAWNEGLQIASSTVCWPLVKLTNYFTYYFLRPPLIFFFGKKTFSKPAKD